MKYLLLQIIIIKLKNNKGAMVFTIAPLLFKLTKIPQIKANLWDSLKVIYSIYSYYILYYYQVA